MSYPKICMIGAGSTVFVKNLMGDILSKPALANCHLSLMDIDPQRLEESELVARKIVASVDANPEITTHTNRKEALEGADFVINMIQVGGYEPCTVTDFEIAKKYGLRQTIADTLGIGGIMRGLRTVPVMLDICDDMRKQCPNAILLNYTNPMAIISRAITRMAPDIQYVGLCHSVQGTAEELAKDLGEKIEDIVYECAGINHMAFYSRFEKKQADGSFEDLYPRLKEIAKEGKAPEGNKVRYEMLLRTGHFVTESSEHFAEYTPWFIKRDRPDLIEKFNIPLDEYPRRCIEQIANWKKQAEEYKQADSIEVKASHEYAATILNSVVTGDPSVIYGNVANKGLIDNLPAESAVEVACLIDANGIQPIKVGSIAPQLAALMQTNINVQELAVEALATGKREHIYHAAMMDPHTAAELDLDQIWALVDDMIEAHGDWMPEFN